MEGVTKNLKFFDTQKMPFQTVNRLNFQQEISRNYPSCSKISLKFRIDFFILVKGSNKFQDIPIARTPRSVQIDEVL